MITGLLNIDDGEILINGKSLEHDFEAAMENIRLSLKILNFINI